MGVVGSRLVVGCRGIGIGNWEEFSPKGGGGRGGWGFLLGVF